MSDEYDKRLTKLVPSLEKILNYHNTKAFEIHEWLRSIGAKTCVFFDTVERFQQRTHVEIRIRHDNDYIECGRPDPDPEGKMFHVFTIEKVEIEFPSDKLTTIVKTLDKFANRKVHMRRLKYVFLSFYSWQRKVKLGSRFGASGLKMPLEFRIYHRR